MLQRFNSANNVKQNFYPNASSTMQSFYCFTRVQCIIHYNVRSEKYKHSLLYSVIFKLSSKLILYKINFQMSYKHFVQEFM